MSSQCERSGSLASRRLHAASAAAPPRNSSLRRCTSSGLSLLLLMVLAGEMVIPVRGGMMDFSPPGLIQYGTCAQPKDHESFHFEQFNGLWYQVEMVPNSYMEPKKCITLDFLWNGTAYNVTTTGLNEYNERVQQGASIKRVLPQDPATIRPYLQIWAPGVPPVPYHVVMTDYTHYACVYSCYELFELMFEAFSILSRSAEIDDASLAACHRAFNAMELDLTRLEPVEQDGDCLDLQLDGSGDTPEHHDEEGEEDENALAALTSGEVNQRRAPNPASVPRSGPATGEGETMMEEEMEDLVEEVDGGRGRGGEEESSLTRNRNGTEVIPSMDSRGGAVGGSVQVQNPSRRRPYKGRRRRPVKGGQRRGNANAGGGKMEAEDTLLNSRDSQLYLDDLALDSLYDENGGRRGRIRGGGGGGHNAEDERRAVTTSVMDRLPLHGGSGGAPGPALLLLVAMVSLVLWPRVPPVL